MVQLHEKVRATRTDTELDRELEKLSGFLFAGHDGDISRHEKLLSKYEQLLVSRIESMAKTPSHSRIQERKKRWVGSSSF
jgi:hypothetical protein